MGMHTSATCANRPSSRERRDDENRGDAWRHTNHVGAVTVSAGSACALCAAPSLSSARQCQIGGVSAVGEQLVVADTMASGEHVHRKGPMNSSALSRR